MEYKEKFLKSFQYGTSLEYKNNSLWGFLTCVSIVQYVFFDFLQSFARKMQIPGRLQEK